MLFLFGVLLLDICLMVLIVLFKVGGLLSFFIIGFCGILVIVFLDIVDWWLSSWLKCCVYFFVMRVGFLIIVCLLKLKSGLVFLDDGLYIVLSLLKNFLVFFVFVVDWSFFVLLYYYLFFIFWSFV